MKTAETIEQDPTDPFDRKSMAIFEKETCPISKHNVKIKCQESCSTQAG
jgi:hypothetical protein